MTSGYKVELLVSFSDVFDEQAKDLKAYLTGISRSKLLTVGTFFLGFDNQNSESKDYRKFLSMFFCPENNSIANQIYLKLNILRQKESAELIIVNRQLGQDSRPVRSRYLILKRRKLKFAKKAFSLSNPFPIIPKSPVISV
jgi:hypothetical protein